MTSFKFNYEKAYSEAIPYLDNASTNMEKIGDIVGSLDIPSLSSAGIITSIPAEVKDCITICEKVKSEFETKCKLMQQTIDYSCSETSKCECYEINEKDFNVNN